VFSKTFFDFDENWNPFRLADRWLNPYKFIKKIEMRGREVEVRWTKRAQRELSQRTTPLVAEMSLYFSCVVKKRLVFSNLAEQSCVPVNEKLRVSFRTIQPESCEPVLFANNYPIKMELDSKGANKMTAKWLEIDFRAREWIGEFKV